MKGKIYKNKLTSATSNQHLNTDISSIYPPFYNQNTSNPQPYSPGSRLLSPKNNTNNQLKDNTIFRRPSQNKTFIHQLFPQSINNKNNTPLNNNLPNNNLQNQYQTNSFIQQLTSPYNQNNQSYQNNNHRLLKRITSNPNLTSYQFLVSPQNRQEQQDPVEQNSILDKTSNSNSMYHVPPNNSSKITQKGINNLLTNQNNKFQHPRNLPLSHLQNQQFNSTSPYNSAQYAYLQAHNNQLLQNSNLMFINNENSILKPQMSFNNSSDYIVAYQKRHKQRISALESQHELQLQFLQQEMKSKDQIIDEMKKMLKQKEQIIKRLQSQNANLSSRSYISFANGNYGKD